MVHLWCLLLMCPIIMASFETEENLHLVDNNEVEVERKGAKDNLDHDCWNVREIPNEEYIKTNPVLSRVTIAKKHKKIINKWNQAYGIPVIGMAKFKVSSMRRACYLLRFLFADNEWLRRYAIGKKMYFMGANGGYCCPPNMGNKGLSCNCHTQVPNPKTPAHEAAHFYIKRVIERAAMKGLIKLPEFTDDALWNYTKSEYLPKKGKQFVLQDYLYNSLMQDKANKNVKADAQLGHYFIYTGQDKYLAFDKAGKLRDDQRARAAIRNPNLQKLMKVVWPCNNDYVQICKDAAYGYRMAASQALKIGKADPQDHTKMICSSSHDTPELDGRGERIERTDDYFEEEKPTTEAEKRKSHKARCQGILDGGANNFTPWLPKPTGSKGPNFKCYPYKCGAKSGLCESFPNGCGKNGYCCKLGEDTDGDCGQFQDELARAKGKKNCKEQHCCVYKGQKDEICETEDCRQKKLPVGVINEAIKEGPEYYEKGEDTDANWWLQHCCSKTAKFPWANTDK